MQQSLTHWTLAALGLPYAVVLLLAGLASLLLVLVVVIRGKGPMAVASLFLIIPLPLLIGAFAALQKGIASYLVITTSDTAPKPAEVAVSLSTALVGPMVGMLLTLPSYAVALIGTFFRSFTSDEGRK